MEKKKTAAMNIGPKGLGIVLLSFASCYLYSVLTSDSLNVTVGVFGEMGLNTNVIYSLATVATICGIIGSIVFGAVSQKRLRHTWAFAMIVAGVFCLIWSQAHSMAIYAIGYLVSYTLTLVSAQLLGFNVMANWFPKKRGVALGIATAGYPLSAATTTTVASRLAGNISMFYILYGVIAIIIGVIIVLYVRDFPEEKNAYPDNDKNFDFELAKKEHEEGLEYLKTSKWTVKKVLTTGRTWHLWLSISITGFLSMGIMSNFLNRFLEGGYETAQILVMLLIAGVVAIPGSVFVGWFDVKFGTKAASIMIGIFAIVAVGFNLTQVHALHYISLPFLAVMLGGSSNVLTSCTSAIWGRYDFQRAFRVVQPLNAIMTGVGITVVGIVGTNFSYYAAYVVMFIMAIFSFILLLFLKVQPIDEDVK